MKISFDASQLVSEQAFAAALTPKFKRRIWNRVRVVSFNAERMIKIRMPVDTGRARASWGHSTAPAGADEGIWEEHPEDMALTQGSRVEYIQYLNEGHSKQAPAGFIDAIERQSEEELERGIEQDIDEGWR